MIQGLTELIEDAGDRCFVHVLEDLRETQADLADLVDQASVAKGKKKKKSIAAAHKE